MNFDQDNLFLVKTFENIVSSLPITEINEAKVNGSYYNFYIKTKQNIIIPKAINFTFKYFNLIAEDNPEYFKRVIAGWNKVLHPNFGDPFDPVERQQIVDVFDNIYDNDYFKILPPIEDISSEFVRFKNLENQGVDVELKLTTATKFKTLYESAYKHMWRGNIQLLIFPVNDISYYRIIDNKLTMIYPIWNSYRWSVETPAYIMDERYPLKVFQFKKFNVNTEQISIRMMNGQLPKELFV